jgi:hypothetical protein
MVLSLPHLHNDELQALPTETVHVFVVQDAVLVTSFPLLSCRTGASMRVPESAVALAGMSPVPSYLGFTLT